MPVMADRVWWLNHQVPEGVPDPRSAMAKSCSNAFEVEIVVGLVEYLVNTNEYDFKDITILTPYNGQLAAFTERLSGTCSLWLSETDRESLIDDGLLDPEDIHLGGKTDVQISTMLKLATIDNFQGEESKVVILSTVRSNPEGRVGFLRTPNRINVGCSRARKGFYIVGNASLMRGVGMWHQIVDALSAKGKIGSGFRTCCPRHPNRVYSVYSPDQWDQIPECQIPCGTELPCGHVCTMKCHAPSLHERVGCDKPCPRRHEDCGHACMKPCGEKCGDCSFPLQNITLSCGHEATQTCADTRKTDQILCNIPLKSVQLPCGHWQEVRCCSKDAASKCTEKCSHTLRCGHPCGGTCCNCTVKNRHSRCSSACSKELPCGHRCAAPCHGGTCPPCRLPCQRSCRHGGCSKVCSKVCDPCVRSCDWTCPHIGPCTTMCCLPCDRMPCNEPCTETLPCGHLCPSLCGERCPTRCLQCVTSQIAEKTQMFLPCGHHFDLEFLDKHMTITELYDLDSTGHIGRVRLAHREEVFSMDISCPLCGYDCKDIRRYALSHQMSALEGNIDRIYAKFCRKLNMFMEQMYDAKSELDKTFGAFNRVLRPGPLSGRRNEEVVRNRGNALAELQRNITDFRGKKDSLQSMYSSN